MKKGPKKGVHDQLKANPPAEQAVCVYESGQWKPAAHGTSAVDRAGQKEPTPGNGQGNFPKASGQ
jgi:hypothetical protein